MASPIVGVTKFQKMTNADPTTIIVAGIGRGNELPKMKALFPKARVIGCEPLREHLRLINRRDLWIFEPEDLYPLALSNKNGTAKLHCNYEPDQRATFYELMEPLPNGIVREIETITLDELHKRSGPWGDKVMLWLDTEGSEHLIIEAATESFKNVHWLNVELSMISARDTPLMSDVVDLLRGRGFRLLAVHSLSRDGRMFDGVFVRQKQWEQLREENIRASIERKRWRLHQRKAKTEASAAEQQIGGRRRRRRR